MSAQASLEPPLLSFSLAQQLVAEWLGTALLLAIVVGSGIMGERLAGGNTAIALLGNTLCNRCRPSGADRHFWAAFGRALQSCRDFGLCGPPGAVPGQSPWPTLRRRSWALSSARGWPTPCSPEPLLQISTKDRSGWAQGLSEVGCHLRAHRDHPGLAPVPAGGHARGWWACT